MTEAQDAAIGQQALAANSPPNLFVRACPGAGKTRTVVDRFVRLADGDGRAVGVISFTNRAADEIAARCQVLSRGELSTYPHFIGTFDRFVATFIVRPFGDLGGPIRIIESWDALDVQIAGNGGRPVSLDHFEILPNGVLRFDPGPGDPDLTNQHAAQREYTAAARLAELRADGYLTCDLARTYALRLLQENPSIGALLSLRFQELIVDEAQDCSAQELDLLDLLRAAGLNVVVVCDPNQAIYEWRDASPARLEQFRMTLTTLELTGNWRSTPAICSFAASLKADTADTPVGDYSDDDTPIHVLRYTGYPKAQLATRFLELVDHHGIAHGSAAVLSHRASVAARAAGSTTKDVAHRAGLIAVGSARVADSRVDPRERRRELERMTRLVLEFVNVSTVGRGTAEAAEAEGIQLEWLNTSALQLIQRVNQLSPDMLAPAWVQSVRLGLAQIAATANRQSKAPGAFLPTPPGSQAKSMKELVGAHPGIGIPHSSVHQAKGSEMDAVLVVIPKDKAPTTRSADLIDAWQTGQSSEAKRVLYVAVTRARRLCVVGVPEALAAQAHTALDAHDVPYETELV